jgi:lipid II:glycine glycyltransferase (peptidoglycan interpeptide bridge formation enzyme)
MNLHSSISEIDQAQWQELVANSPTSSYFQTPECYHFFESLSFLKPFVFGVSENNKLVGILSGYIISDGNILTRFFSRRAIVCGGALLDTVISENAVEKLLMIAGKTLKKQSIYLEIRNYTDYSVYKSIFETVGFTYTPHLNFHVQTEDVETAKKNLSTTRRREIKLSLKSGAVWCETRNPDDIKSYYKILQDLYRNKVKTPLYPLEFFESLVKNPNGKLFIVKNDSKIIGGSVCVLLPERILYEWFVCGLDGQFKNVYPSTIATWAAIEYAASNGYKRFDMMGAGKPDEGYGVREFKSKFGGELVENGRFIHISNPLLFKIGELAVGIMRSNRMFSKKTIVNKLPVKNDRILSFKVETQIKNIDKNEWSDFIIHHPNGNIFQTPGMFDVYNKTPKFTPVILIAKDENNKIVGCLMSVIQRDYRSYMGEMTARSIVMGGPLAIDNNSEILDLLLKVYTGIISKKAIYSQFRNLFTMNNYVIPFVKNGYRFVEHLDILIDLEKSKKELEEQLHKERVRNIAKAVKEGLTFKVLDEDDDIRDVIILLKKTYDRVRLPFAYEKLFFNSKSILNEQVKFFGAYFEDKMIAGQVRLCYKDTVYAWYSGSDSIYFQKRPNDFLLWNVILWSKENNYKVFDFGGAGKPNIPYGVRDYKLKFGGELVNYGRYEKEHKKVLMLLGRIAFKFYKISKR